MNIGIIGSGDVGQRLADGFIDPKNFTDKIVIDVTNPLDFSKGMPPRTLLERLYSVYYQIQKL